MLLHRKHWGKRKLFPSYSTPKWYTSYEELAADPEVDIIYIATTNHLHMNNISY